MDQNIIELGFDMSKFTPQQKEVIEGLNEVYKTAERIDGLKIGPGINPSWKGLKDAIAAQTKEIKNLQDANIQYIKAQEALTKSETAQIVQMQQKEKLAQQEIKTRKAQTAETNASTAASAKEAKILNELTNEYMQLNKAYNDAVTKYRNLFILKGEDAEATKRQLQTVTEYRTILDKMDKNLNIHTRNVGNYSSAFNGLGMSIQQVGRELPTLAINFQMFALAISNNLPILADELGRASAEIKKLKAEGKEAPSLFQQISKSIFSWQTALTLAITLFTVFSKEIANFVSGLSNAEKASKNFADVQKESKKAVVEERLELTALLAIAQDDTKTREERSAAVKKINDLMPDYLGNLTLESVKTQQGIDVIVKYIEMLNKKALAQAYLAKAQSLHNDLIDIEAKTNAESISWYQKAAIYITGYTGVLMNLNSGKDVSNALDKAGNTEKKEAIRLQNDLITKNQEAFLADLKSGKALLDLDKMLKQGKEDKTPEKNRQAAYETSKMILELERDRIKALMEDESKSLDERFSLLNDYTKKVDALIVLQRDYELAQKDITEGQKTKITTQANVDRVRAEMDTLKMVRDMNDQHLKELEKQRKEAEKKAKEAKEAAVKTADDNISAEEIRNRILLNNELMSLNERFLNGEITDYKEYEREKELISYLALGRTVEHLKNALKKKALLYDEDSIEYKKIQDKISELDKNQSDAGVKIAKDASDKKKDYLREIEQVSMESIELMQELTTAQYDNEIARLQELQDKQAEYYATEIENIKNSSLAEEQKASRIRELELRASTDRKKIDAEIRAENIKKAKAEREFQVFKIIGNTAIGIMSALAKTPPDPILASLIGAIGAIQIARTIATPIPKYADGTDNHPGGLAIYGEAGAEMVREPGKSPYVVDQATLGMLPKGTKVTPMDEVNQHMMNSMLRSQGRFMNADSNDSNWDVARWQTARLEKAFNKVGKRPVRVNITTKQTLDVNRSFGR